jgi:nicotinate phosphoribosyltransferase
MKNIAGNLTMLVDFYELTMGNGYLKCGINDRITYFDVFYRNNPDGGGYAVAAGLEQIVDYINDLHFTNENIEFLRSKN